MAKAKAYLIPDVEIHWSCSKATAKNIPLSDKLHYSDGIKDYLNNLCTPNDPIFEDPFYFNTEIDVDSGKIEGIINWLDAIEPINESYCNTIKTPLGVLMKTVSSQEFIRHLKIFQKLNTKRNHLKLIKKISLVHPDQSYLLL